LESLSIQTHPADEIIVVWQDDDVVTKIAAERAGDLLALRVRTVHSEVIGVVPAENAGLAVALGDIILLIDDDAVAPVDWVARHLAHYDDSNVGAVGGPYLNHDPDGTRRATRRPAKVAKLEWYGRFVGNLFDHCDEWYSRAPSVVDHLAGGNLSLRRSAFDRFEENLRPYWQLFEADACLQVHARGLIVLLDWGNRVDHFPTSGIFDNPREGDLDRRVFNWAYNHGYILGKHRSWPLKIAGLAYLLLVGSTANPGLLGAFRALYRFGDPLREFRILRGTLRAHFQGWCAGVSRAFVTRTRA
jgi:GT2 family glycosyltransferase